MCDKKTIERLLSNFVAIPSISSDPRHIDDMRRAAAFLEQTLSNWGFSAEVMESSGGHPMVVGRYHAGDALPTIAMYGHYDVQPPDPLDEWKTPPFELTRTGETFVGRGVADNKGHIIQNIVAIGRLIRQKTLRANILFLIEGEEESGSEHFEAFVKKLAPELSRSSACFITDVGMYAKDVPQIVYALRGLAYFELSIETGEADLHSGVYGNAAPNALTMLSELLSGIKDTRTGDIRIPGFYDDVVPVPEDERALLRAHAPTHKSFIQDEMKSFVTIPSLSQKEPLYLLPKIFPSFDIHGVVGGFTGTGPKTVIPKSARAKFSFRLVPDQDARSIEKLVRKHIGDTLPQGTKWSLTSYSYDNPFITPYTHQIIQRVAHILSDHFQQETVLSREGGSIPAAEIISRHHPHLPIILTGFILPDSNLHAPNEQFDCDMFYEGIEVLEKIYLSF